MFTFEMIELKFLVYSYIEFILNKIIKLQKVYVKLKIITTETNSGIKKVFDKYKKISFLVSLILPLSYCSVLYWINKLNKIIITDNIAISRDK